MGMTAAIDITKPIRAERVRAITESSRGQNFGSFFTAPATLDAARVV